MKNENRRPILTKGEEYLEVIKKNHSNPQGEKPELEIIRQKIFSDIEEALEKVEKIDSHYLMKELVINLRMNLAYGAKSYHPTELIKYIGAEDIGSKKYFREVYNEKLKKEELKIGKEIFLKLSKEKLEKFKSYISTENEVDGLKSKIKENIQCLDSLFLDSHSEIYEKFIGENTVNTLEIVLHPFNEENILLIKKIKETFLNYEGEEKSIKYKTYPSGVTFVSVKIKNKETVEELLKYNGIRTINKLNFRGIPYIRSIDNRSLPFPPQIREKSKIKVGVFDGGVLTDCDYFKDFVNENNPCKKVDGAEIESLSHGTGVVGAILYGDLTKYKRFDTLKTPIVNVESFKVLPLSDNNDIDLYEIIDKIEEVIPKYKDEIKVYNLSLGPVGAIDDDNISRFTYAIDELSKDGDILFVVAVGNDGELKNGLGRIQSPSDSVNCLGIGSYCFSEEGKEIRASYSCYGDGREGSKVKPDLLEFGGDSENPFQLISFDKKNVSMSCGTSFATPLISAKAAEIIGRFNLGNPLIAKNLLIHTAKINGTNSDKLHGHGFALGEVDEILYCTQNKVTVTYQSKIQPKKSVKIPIPFVKGHNFKGKIKIDWTITTAVDIDAKNTEDYTLACIEDTFYPHSKKYKIGNKIVNLDTEQEKIKLAQEEGLKLRGPNTYSNSKTKYRTEEERKSDFKWDTVVKRSTNSMLNTSLEDPYIVLHAMERYNSFDYINYSIVVTIHYLKCDEDMYELTLKKYNKLEVSSIRTVNEVIIKN